MSKITQFTARKLNKQQIITIEKLNIDRFKTLLIGKLHNSVKINAYSISQLATD